ncbi:ribonuclease inhibitor-like [Salvelinus alpinus]|uniref:ribonuclease inhibitor-like n=1 Tax=Salvelinus alpinus TaxID=8036 RepID=UPI0039FDB433
MNASPAFKIAELRKHPVGLYHCLVRQLHRPQPQSSPEGGAVCPTHYWGKLPPPPSWTPTAPDVTGSQKDHQGHQPPEPLPVHPTIIQKARLRQCNLSELSCESLASVLCSNSTLKELDLRDNNLGDSGVELLSAELGDPRCASQVLGLSGCLVTEEGCASLASALGSNPSHLRELDLSFNHPGDSGVKLLSDRLEDPHCRLEKLM